MGQSHVFSEYNWKGGKGKGFMEDDNGQRARVLTRKSLLSGLFTGFSFGFLFVCLFVIISNMTVNIAHVFCEHIFKNFS